MVAYRAANSSICWKCRSLSQVSGARRGSAWTSMQATSASASTLETIFDRDLRGVGALREMRQPGGAAAAVGAQPRQQRAGLHIVEVTKRL